MTIVKLSDDLLNSHVKSMSEWELISNFVYCQKSLTKSKGYENEIFLIAFELFNCNLVDAVDFLINLKKIYTNEYSSRKCN